MKSTRGIASPDRAWIFAATIALILLAGCAITPIMPPAAKSELAATGKLRVGLFLGNPVLVVKDAASGELRGVAVDLGRELAARLGVPLELVGYPSVARLFASVTSGEWDIAFLGFDPARAAGMEVSAPYMEVETTYLVAPGSRIRSIAEVDQPGVRIAVATKSASDVLLSRTLKHAQLVRGAGGTTVAFEMLRTGQADAIPGNGPFLADVAAKLPGSRILEGRLDAVKHAVAAPKGRTEGGQYLRNFIEEAKATGFVQRAIDRAGLLRVVVAPPAQGK